MNKLNPLHTAKWLAQAAEATGCYPDISRCTGRSTAHALHLLSVAIKNPHCWVYVEDHHGTAGAHEHLQQMALSMAAALGLQHFVAKPRYIAFGRPE